MAAVRASILAACVRGFTDPVADATRMVEIGWYLDEMRNFRSELREKHTRSIRFSSHSRHSEQSQLRSQWFHSSRWDTAPLRHCLERKRFTDCNRFRIFRPKIIHYGMKSILTSFCRLLLHSHTLANFRWFLHSFTKAWPEVWTEIMFCPSEVSLFLEANRV